MNKQQLIQTIQEEVKTSLENSISDNLENFEVIYNEFGDIKIESNEKESGNKNTCEFIFNWYN